MSVALKLILALAAVSLAGLFALASLALGLECIRRSRFPAALGLVARLGLGFAIGHLVLSVVMQLCAAFGLFDRISIATFFVVAVVIGRRSLMDAAREFVTVSEVNAGVAAVRRSWSTDRVYTATVLFVAACVIGGVAPLFITFYGPPAVDALAYYLAQAKLVAFTGDLSPVPGYEAFQVLSNVAEMPFAAMYLFGGETVGHFAAKATIVPVVVATLTLMWGIGAVCGLRSLGKWLVLLLLMTSSSYLLVAFDGKSDLVSNLYAVAAVLTLLLGSDTQARAGAAWFGALCGGALIAKFSLFAVLPAALATVILWMFWSNSRGAVKYVGISAASAMAVFLAGWMVKNFVLFGDPFVPFYQFKPLTPEFPTAQVWYAEAATAWIQATYPLALTFGRYPMQYGQISIGWLLILPCFLAVRRWQNKCSLVLLAGALLAIAAWVYLRPSILAPRYFFPAISMAMFAFAYAAEAVFRDRERRIIALLAIGTLGMTGLLFAAASAYRIQLAVSYYASYVSDRPWLPELHRARELKRLARGERVLFLSYQNEYLRADLLNDMVPAKAVGATVSDADRFWNYLESEKIRYVVVDKSHPYGGRIDMESTPAHYEIDRQAFLEGHYYLYELKRLE